MTNRTDIEGPARKRGAQPGNTNALKHGFYAKGFHEIEMGELEAYFDGSVDDEIAMLRVTARRLFLMAKDEVTLDKMIVITNTLGAVCTRLAGMLRLRTLMNSRENNSVEKTIQQALNDVLADLAPGLTK